MNILTLGSKKSVQWLKLGSVQKHDVLQQIPFEHNNSTSVARPI